MKKDAQKKEGKRRGYHSVKRQQQAEATRLAVINAARTLFLRTGYHATTIEAIAVEAGVATPTVYGVFGSKRALMIAISDDMDVRGGFVKLASEMAATTDAREQLRMMAASQVDFFLRNADVFVPLREAGRGDETLAELWNEGYTRHHRAYARLAQSWDERGALRRGLDHKEAADVMSGLTWIEMYWYFERCGWTADRYREWVISTIDTLILTPAR